MAIQGVHTAIVTPFGKDGQIDWAAFDKLLEMQAKAEVDGVIISGTTGETPTLTVDEKVSLFRRARAFLPPSVQVMAGTGGNDTRSSIELSKLAQDAGVNSLLVVTPPYNKPSREGLRAHYEAIGSATRIPICLYHVPGRTAQKLSPEDLAYLCEVPQVTCVKEASADLFLFSKALLLSKADYLSGDDFTYLPSLAVGGKGVISVVTNIFPRAFVMMTRKFLSKDVQGALDIHNALLPLTEGLFSEASPSPTKDILAHRGIIQNVLRLPLVPVQTATHERLLRLYKDASEQLEDLGVLS
jgi:4-hydroxy-tetrahydrodipicolinate synthase